MRRGPNEIDFWRGFALVTIFIDHVPGLLFENYTFKNIGISDAAELFVFLAGYSLRLLVDNPKKRLPTFMATLRLESRAFTIYAAQTVITLFALAMTAGGSMLLENPLFLEWNNAAAVFENPIEAIVGLALLSHQLGFFDILPLYVVLIAFAPLLVVTDRIWKWLPLILSGLLYVVTLATGTNLETWPVEGRWYFNPLAWQFIFTLGFFMADPAGPAMRLREHKKVLRILALPIVILAAIVGLTDYAPDPLSVPSPRLFFMFDKTFDTPARVIHLLALVALFNGLFDYVLRYARRVARYLSMLGRNSLQVFCVGSLVSLGAQFSRFVLGGSLAVDTGVVLTGMVVMGLTAFVVEWRERIRTS